MCCGGNAYFCVQIFLSSKIFVKEKKIVEGLSKHFFIALADTPDEQTGGDSSKSNSITSEHSIHSMGVSGSSQSSSTNSLPPAANANHTGDNLNYDLSSIRLRNKVKINQNLFSQIRCH